MTKYDGYAMIAGGAVWGTVVIFAPPEWPMWVGILAAFITMLVVNLVNFRKLGV